MDVYENSPPVERQRTFWNEWNAETRERSLDRVSLEQAQVIVDWIGRIGRPNLKIIEVGCGVGWLCPHLTAFGQVTGTDLSDEVLARARERAPDVQFVSGDFMDLQLGSEVFDVVVSLEVLSHVSDQPAFLAKLAHLLVPGGWLMLATQNRPALERNLVPPPRPGQIRRWVDREELSELLAKDFYILEISSITPKFNRGPLRFLNSQKLRQLSSALLLGGVMRTLDKIQERLWLGWTLMALARRRD